ATSLAPKSKRAPHFEQNPTWRPGTPFLPRPTGLSQRVQKRRPSGTLGSAMTTLAGSTAVIGVISTTPAPTRLRRVVVPVDRVERVVRRVTSTRPDTGPEAPVRRDGAAPAGTGASPHVSQYPSRMVPVQPGRPQVVVVTVIRYPQGGA